MSEETNQVAENETAQDKAAGGGEDPGGTRRKVVLFGVLGLVLVMLGYDYRVARPAVDKAYDQIVEHVAEVNNSTTDTVSNLDVRTLLGKEPARTFKDGDYLVEVFSWRAGLPIRTHDLYTVYKPTGDEQLFYRHAKFVYEARGDVAPVPETTMTEQPEFDAEGQAAASARNQATRGGGPPAAPAPSPDQRGRPELEEEKPAGTETDDKPSEASEQ